MDVYLDNSATTPVCAEAIAAMRTALETTWGNPSSLHKKGLEAEALLEHARAQVARKLRCEAEEIYFTSGGTESNNIALLGAARARFRLGKRVVSTNVEHSSVEESLKRLEAEGFEVLRLPVDGKGRICEEDLGRAITPQTILVSIMSVNNETGTIQPVEAARRAIQLRRSPAWLHCDAVQSFGKLELYPAALGLDMMSVSAHKIHGPKGAGALYLNKNTIKNPKSLARSFGGAQEGGVRAGTQLMPAIAGFGAAVEAIPNTAETLAKMQDLRTHMLDGLRKIGGIALNSPPGALPYVTNISVLGKKGEPLLNYLSGKGVYVSTGSACAKGKPSHVLKAMGLPKERLEGALRISFSRFTTMEDIDRLLRVLAEGKTAVMGK